MLDKEFMVEQLQEAINPLKNVEGMKTVPQILKEMSESKFVFEATILRNKRFELIFNHQTQEIELKTTFSNQTVTPEFMNEMMLINQKQNWIGACLKTISKMENIED